MAREFLQMSMFGPGIFDTVELTELYGKEPGGIFDIPIGPDLKPMSMLREICWPAWAGH